MRVLSDVMAMQCNGFDVVVRVRVEMVAGLPLIAGPLHHVVQVRNDARRREGVAVIIEINAPGVAGSVGEDVELASHRMVSPDAGIDRLPLVVRSAGLADVGVREHAVAAIQPAVRTPRQRVW